MGGFFSQPWRNFPSIWWHLKNLKFLKSYKPKNTNTQHLRILLLGPTGAGKSSFINSVYTVVLNRIKTVALTAEITGTSFTKEYKTYKIKTDSENVCSFVLNDTMGLEGTDDGGIHVDDIKLVLKGHVKEGFKFRPQRQITEEDPGYNSTPTLEDRVHVLVHVFPADKISVISETVLKKMKDVRQAAFELGIPQLIIITKVDEVCPKTKQDVTYAHYNKEFEKQVNTLSSTLGIPPNCIFLVKNYNTEMRTHPDMNALILSALRRMVEAGEDFLND